MAEKTDVVIYIDRASVEHNALVVGVNNLNPDVLDVTYFDLKSDALKTEFGVPHMSDESKKETNPTLPQYSLNCWKKDGEEHLALPVDHPANDHPFEPKKQDDSGRIVTKPRPEFEKHLAEVASAKGAHPMAGTVSDVDPGELVIGTSGGTHSASEIAIVEPSDSERRSPDAYFVPPVEPDVIAQLDAAGPAPVEEKKPEDAA